VKKHSIEYGNFFSSTILKPSKIQLKSAANRWYYPQLPIHHDRTAERSNRILVFLKLSFFRDWKYVVHFVLFWLHSDCVVTG